VETALMIGFGLQWIAIIALGMLGIGLFRQLGLLHERLGPVGALTIPGGPNVGSPAPFFELPTVNGSLVRVGGQSEDGRSSLIFFLSPTCPICKELLPVVRSVVANSHTAVRLIFASDGDESEQNKMIASEKLERFPFVLSAALGIAHGVSKLPYAVLIGPEGNIVAKGLVNTREHIESLFEAGRTGIPSIQDYLARRSGAGIGQAS
jgi:methylamine dehydrogenase accessory protein MauD